MTAVNVYVGADNATHQIDLDRLAKIASRDVPEGFTMITARGYWHGQSEPSAVLTVDATPGEISRLVDDVKSELDQDAVGVQRAAPITLE